MSPQPDGSHLDGPDPFAGVLALEGVGSRFTAARDGIDAVLRDRGLRRSTSEDTGRSLLLGAVASARLEGADLRPGDEGVEVLLAGGGGVVAQAALRLGTELLGLAPTWRTTPVQALARIHAVAAAGWLPADRCGRPSGPAGAAALADLARDLVAPTRAPALVVAAQVHARIAVARPFDGLDGVVARAAERLVLVTSGLDPASVTVPEAGHDDAAAAYHVALRAWPEDGGARWLDHAAEAYTRAAELSPLASPSPRG